MKFNELIKALEEKGAIAVQCETFIVRNLEDWTKSNKERVQAIIEAGNNPSKSKDAIDRKKRAQEIYDALQDPKNIHPAGWLPKTNFSIYPLP